MLEMVIDRVMSSLSLAILQSEYPIEYPHADNRYTVTLHDKTGAEVFHSSGNELSLLLMLDILKPYMGTTLIYYVEHEHRHFPTTYIYLNQEEFDGADIPRPTTS